MAHLTVMGDYQGPGEQKAAETLARDLPDAWRVIAGRKLSGPRRDDLDLVVVGEHAVFVLDEKSWGPQITLGDQFWRVRGGERRNPLDRVNHLARVLAGQFRDRVPGYRAAAQWLRDWDASFGSELQPVRDAVIAFLLGLQGRERRPDRIGPYEIVEEIAPVGVARCFHAKDGSRTVILRCNPMHFL